MENFKPNWMPKPRRSITNCPPGLEYLLLLDHILIQDHVAARETWTRTLPKYWVKNKAGQDIYYAAYDREIESRFSLRPLDMEITDNKGSEVIHLHKPNRCGHGCGCPFQRRVMRVYAPVGQKIGSVVEEWACNPTYAVQNATGDAILRVKGAFNIGCCSCGTDLDFEVLSMDNRRAGQIRKCWDGWMQDTFVGQDNFGISFPMDLDVRMKAVMLGASFLINHVYYENQITAVNT